ncbi:MAG TPA: cytochrome c [Anaerolineae bacterium]|nr:cytochrome c [Anaerolineae bacterium]
MSTLHRTWLALGLLTIVLLVGACGTSPGGIVTQGDATHGRSLWAQSDCIGCHGVHAEGSRGGPALANTPLTNREVTNIVRRGGPGMPKYSASQISDQDLQDMYAWFQNPVPAPTGELEQDPWALSGCGGCHGASAEGASAPALAGSPQPFSAFETVVRQGTEGMPKYSASQISDQTLQDIYTWLQAQVQVPTATDELEQDPWTQSACAGCHGVNALGGSGPSLAGTSQPFSAFETVVRQGAEGMPPFSGTQLSDQTLQAIYEWLQAQAQVPAAQRALWDQAGCGGCHGANAEGASAPALTGEEFVYDEFQRVVREGEEGMPAYGTSQISDTDLQRMYDWLMALP